MPAVALRPRSATELVDAAFRLLRTCYTKLAALAAVALAPYIVLVLIVRVDPLDPARVLGAALLQLLCLTIAEAAVVLAASEIYLEGALHGGSALATALRRVPVVIAAQLVRYFFIGVLTMAAVFIPAMVAALAFSGARPVILGAAIVVLAILLVVYAGLSTILTVPALLLERAGPVYAVQRSWRLVRGQWWHTFWAMCLAWIIYLAVFVVLSLAISMLMTANPVVSRLLSAIVLAFAYPLIGVVTTLLYYDLRMRKEGFDLERTALQLGVPEQPPPSLSPPPAAPLPPSPRGTPPEPPAETIPAE